MRYSKLMKLRTVGFCLALALGSSGAFASFELVMVGDSATKSIHRFDGSTGAYLGSFGSGHFANIQNFTIDQATNSAYVSDGVLGLTRVFNYNTGAHLFDYQNIGSNGTSQTLSRTPTGFFAGYYSGGWGIHDNSGAQTSFVLGLQVGGTNPIAMASARHQSGIVVGAAFSGASAAVASLQLLNPNLTTATAKTPDVTDMGPWTELGQVSLSGNTGIWLTTNGRARVFAVNSAGTNISLTGGSYAPEGFAVGTMRGIGMGHGRTVYVSGRDAGNTTGIITRGVLGSTMSLSTFGSGILQQPMMMQVVVAPEPGTLVALSLGALLLRRRKKS